MPFSVKEARAQRKCYLKKRMQIETPGNFPGANRMITGSLEIAGVPSGSRAGLTLYFVPSTVIDSFQKSNYIRKYFFSGDLKMFRDVIKTSVINPKN